MGATPRLIALAGSLRKDSFNKKLVHVAADAAREAGADVEIIDLSDHRLPLYDQDLEDAEGVPEIAMALKAKFIASDGLLIASPEYNSSISAVLKNTIDWLSRPVEGEKPLAAFKGKVAGLVAASPGALGGLRGLVHVRAILGNIGMLVVPEQAAVSQAHEAFDESGALNDPKNADRVQAVGRATAELAARIAGAS